MKCRSPAVTVKPCPGGATAARALVEDLWPSATKNALSKIASSNRSAPGEASPRPLCSVPETAASAARGVGRCPMNYPPRSGCGPAAQMSYGSLAGLRTFVLRAVGLQGRVRRSFASFACALRESPPEATGIWASAGRSSLASPKTWRVGVPRSAPLTPKGPGGEFAARTHGLLPTSMRAGVLPVAHHERSGDAAAVGLDVDLARVGGGRVRVPQSDVERAARGRR